MVLMVDQTGEDCLGFGSLFCPGEGESHLEQRGKGGVVEFEAENLIKGGRFRIAWGEGERKGCIEGGEVNGASKSH